MNAQYWSIVLIGWGSNISRYLSWSKELCFLCPRELWTCATATLCCCCWDKSQASFWNWQHNSVWLELVQLSPCQVVPSDTGAWEGRQDGGVSGRGRAEQGRISLERWGKSQWRPPLLFPNPLPGSGSPTWGFLDLHQLNNWHGYEKHHRGGWGFT